MPQITRLVEEKCAITFASNQTYDFYLASHRLSMKDGAEPYLENRIS